MKKYKDGTPGFCRTCARPRQYDSFVHEFLSSTYQCADGKLCDMLYGNEAKKYAKENPKWVKEILIPACNIEVEDHE